MAPLRLAASVRIGIAVCGLLGTVPAAAQEGEGADPRIAARTLGYAGIEAYEAGDYPTAERKLERAYQLLPVPSLGLWSARALIQRGRLVEASQRLLAASRSPVTTGDPEVQKAARADAASEHALLLTRIPSIAIELAGLSSDAVSVRLDGALLSDTALAAPIPVNPGQHSIELLRGRNGPARAERRELVHLAEGEKRVVRLALDEVPRIASTEAGPTGASGWRTAGWVAAGVGGGTLLASGIAGLVAWSKLESFDCSSEPCVSTDRDAIDTYETLRTLSTVGYIAGGALLAAGVVVLLETHTDDAQVAVGLGPGGALVQGRF